MPRKTRRLLTAVSSICILALVAPTALLGQQPAEDLDPIQLLAEGWSEESPGLWVREGDDGRFLKARGVEAMKAVLGRLQGDATAILTKSSLAPRDGARLGELLTLIEKIETVVKNPPQKVPDCTRSASVYGGASTSQHQCGVQAWSLASVSSNGDDCQACDVVTSASAEGACSPTSGVQGRSSSCSRNGLSVSCTSSANWLMPYRCWSDGYARVFCPGWPSIDIYDWDYETTCGTGLPCYCSGG